MPFILALDQGTTSSRALMYGPHGEMLAMAQRELPQIYPRPGWVEQDPEIIWATQLESAREVIHRARVPLTEVRAIAITNQRETTIVWNRKTGVAIGNAIVWQDRRTAAQCARLRDLGLETEFKQATGLVLDPYFSGTKVKWLLDHVDGAHDLAERGELAFGTVDSWLIWKLTSGRVHVTDMTNASRTLLLDLARGVWSESLAQRLGVPMSVLPRVVASDAVVGECDRTVFGHPIPIAGVAGDQQAALMGQRCVAPGMVKNTYGTGCFLLMCTGTAMPPAATRLLGTAAVRRGAETDYAIEGAVFNAGSTVQWLRDGLGMISRTDEIEALANSVTDSGDVFLVPAFTGLGAPYWDPHARGMLCGVTRGTTRAHIARAALDAIAHQTADVVEAMRQDTGIDIETLRVDGGAARNNALLQIQADLLRVPVVRSRNVEATALGAAMLGGTAVGVWSNDAELDTLWQPEREFAPVQSETAARAARLRWAEAIERAKGWSREP